ncbi:hypothetical protein [Atopobacter phocae]|uniref:hypothetical protein n=1 Tax=Atopobacter phocae TaxID=136492 RepID=UPI00046F6172|nr:hypothetical protein [Atopobacter phocae]
MSVDRSYLPYRSAQMYQDRKMAKWMGFFLSEHSTALHRPNHTGDSNAELSLEEKVLLCQQAYVNQLVIDVVIQSDRQWMEWTGQITTLQTTTIGFQTTHGHYVLELKDIVTISLAEADEDDEQTNYDDGRTI